ncbi:alpha/beta fold hydrolase [Rhodococcus sp. BP-349]|uniref:alpha/beta fold hydrolase n=1 Tax=unclassified Rhodococcus (in: high G+C Gram-positive bacteria) TaxID=192944 RepID=UPI001C9A8061|nr:MULTISPECIES: alpha/beta hydrolase [unclassified Rhodococcus (in: high G+C Gram-positive bacteria)]MBY6539302.1 alpha/beta fold hydrolase [Rhodococcus sp. BP-363]MBY6544370.1 alpha/beta fold hydrolase [Rhodococcus sp. BP-369]MBY6563600.1 alpha/beta fold hydrolase [Rhodococcus sp. BP-370]MBY6577892.1 alpha/beta fold hydrolase [Rhodococcus sp. BP-364]MBY6587193.1 alpha/beta fold hydrolase [Rhodococcus sp. BP-358]
MTDAMQTFRRSPEGQEFDAAYDRVLGTWPTGTTTTMVPTRFGDTHVTSAGPTDGRPVVLLPGSGATSMAWTGQATELRRHHRVVAVDILGDVGRSVPTGEPVTNVDDLMLWLDDVFAGSALRRPSILAHSYGAMIALAFALRRPADVDRLVLLDPNSCFTGMRAAYLAHALPLLLRPSEERQRRFTAWETGGAVLDADLSRLSELGAAHHPRRRPIVPRRPSSSALRSLQATTTVVLAGSSRIHDSAAVRDRIQKNWPSISTRILDGATHHTFPDSPRAELGVAIHDALTR